MNENHYVVKSNTLIEAKRDIEFSALEEKLILALISEIKIDDNEFKEYEFKIKDFLKLLDVNNRSKIYTEIHNAAKSLMQKVISIKTEDAEIAIAFLSSAKTIKNKGVIILRFDPTLKPYLLNLQEKFTRYQIKNVLKLKANYSIRLYELLKQNLVMGYRIFEIDDLKQLLGLSEKYEKIYDFKVNVIDKALDEINEYTNILVSYEQQKTGRRITHLNFIIKPKFEDNESKMIENLYTKKQIEELKENCGLKNYKVSNKQLFDFYKIAVEKTDHIKEVNVYDYFKLNIHYVEEKNPKNFLSYLKKALTDDYVNAIISLKYKGNF